LNRAVQIENRLRQLLERGALPLSVCGRAFCAALRPLQDTGVVTEERSAAGRRMVVRQPDLLRRFMNERFPNATTFPEASSRVAALARWRDTKALRNHLPEIVVARAWPPDILHQMGRPVPAAVATAGHGAFAFLLDRPSPYDVHGPCALVENPAVFFEVERLRLPVSLVFYGHGRSSGRFLEWLRSMTAPQFSLLHLPDYDPAGLNEHARFCRALGDRVRLHRPSDLEERFRRFANPRLLAHRNSQRVLAALRRSPYPGVGDVLALVERYNAGLEQEALLL
jgi:hypothetical protein